MMSGEEYMSDLGLGDDEGLAEEIQEEIEKARDAWTNIVSMDKGNMSDRGELLYDDAGTASEEGDEEDIDSVLCQLVTSLGTTYSAEDHGASLRALSCKSKSRSKSRGDSGSKGDVEDRLELSEAAFVGWYIRLLFKDSDSVDEYNHGDEEEDEDEDGKEEDDGDGDDDDDDVKDDIGVASPVCGSVAGSAPVNAIGDKSTSIITSASSSASRSIFGAFGAMSGQATRDDGGWKCPACMVYNGRDKRACVCCNSAAPALDGSAVGGGEPLSVRPSVADLGSGSLGSALASGSASASASGSATSSLGRGGISSSGFSFPLPSSVDSANEIGRASCRERV